MLRFDGVAVRLGGFSLDADFAVAPRAITAVIGPSGSGKSTLLGAAAGFVSLASGRVLVGETDITPLAPGARPLSIVFQDGNLFPHLDLATNVALGLDPSGRLSGGAREAVEAALERVGLGGFAVRRPAELSGGEQSRAALARALLRRRPVVLLDEPFAALGPALRHEMLALVAEVFAGETVLMVTHAPDDARRVAAETVFIEAGHAAAPVNTEALFSDPPEALRAYLG